MESKAKELANEATDDKLTSRQQKVADEITKWFALGGVALVASDSYDGMLLVRTAATHADKIVRAARHDKRVFETLEKLTQSSDLFALVSFEGFFLYALAVHHGRLKPNDALLAQFGYHESQVLAPPPDMVNSNGNGIAATI